MINMFERVDKNVFEKLWQGTHTSDMPINFLKVITKFSESNEKYMDEWSLYHVGEGNEEDEEIFCICSHFIQECHYVINNINGNILRVGSECINKFLSDAVKDEMKEVHRRINRPEGSRRWCGGCKRHNILPEEPEWKTVCKKCYKEGKLDTETSSDRFFNKQCLICNKYNIKKTEPEWKNKCYDCYLDEKQERDGSQNKEKIGKSDEIFMKQCLICKKDNIKNSEPEWKRKCYDCYLDEKQEVKPPNTNSTIDNPEKIINRQCSNCQKYNIDKTDPFWKKKCRECFIQTKNI